MDGTVELDNVLNEFTQSLSVGVPKRRRASHHVEVQEHGVVIKTPFGQKEVVVGADEYVPAGSIRRSGAVARGGGSATPRP